MADNRIWLDVAFAEKDEAKAHGARWDPTARRWYAPGPGMRTLDRWQALPDVPNLLPGEDRNFGPGLFVDLVPCSCWFSNVRSCVDQRDWERLRRMITNRADQRCEVCRRGQDREARRWLEAHERWAYDDSNNVQALRRLICLCTDCHTTTHFGLASINGKSTEAFKHLSTITGLPADQVSQHIDAAFALRRRRSVIAWELDLSILVRAGVAVAKPPSATERADLPSKILRRI